MSDRREADDDALDRAVAFLSEHFETVQVFVTRYTPGDDGGTVSADRGEGHWYARFGQVRDWLVSQDARTRYQVRRNMDAGDD